MNETDSYLYHGDRLKYECKTEYWGVNGGIDTYHDEFQCTEEGTLDTPRVGEQWPYCEPQTGSQFLAVYPTRHVLAHVTSSQSHSRISIWSALMRDFQVPYESGEWRSQSRFLELKLNCD